MVYVNCGVEIEDFDCEVCNFPASSDEHLLSREDDNVILFLLCELSELDPDISFDVLENDLAFSQFAQEHVPPSVLEKLSLQQLKEARMVRQVLRRLGYKSNQSIEHLVRSGYLKNLPVASKVFKIVDELVGKSKEVVMGKAKRKPDFKLNVSPLKPNELILEWDLMFLYGHAFLVSVTVPFSHVCIVWLGCQGGEDGIKDIPALKEAAAKVLAYYKSHGFRPVRVVYDGERSLASDEFDTWIRNQGVLPNPLASGRHATRAERKIGHIRSRFRTIQEGIPYSLPANRVPELVQAVAVLINNDCCKANEGWKPPQMCIGEDTPIDYNHIFASAFGDYCLVYLDEPTAKSKDRARATEAIALYPDESRARGWWFWFPEPDTVRCRPYFETYETFSPKIMVDVYNCYVKSMKRAVKTAPNSRDKTSLADLRVKKDGNAVALLFEKHRMQFTKAFEEQKAKEPYLATDWLEDLLEIVDAEALMFATQYSLKQGSKLFGKDAEAVTKKEIEGIIEREVLLGRKFSELSKTQQKKIIRAKVIITEKYVNGVFERLKARLVALGNLQDKSEYSKSELSSPTPSSTIVLMQLAIAAMQKKSVYTFDIGQAFLNSQMSEKEVFIKLSADVAKIMVEINSAYREFLNSDGTMLVQLNKALYGIVEAPRLWYDTFSAFLMKQGFHRSELDACYFFKRLPNGDLVDISVHVDDGLMASKNTEEMDRLIEAMRQEFHILKVNKGSMHDYLSLHIVFDGEGRVHINQFAKVLEVVGAWEVGDKTSSTPHDDKLFKIDSNAEKLDDNLRKKFHSSVQSCLYLSVKSRPDITCAVNYLTTRVKEPTTDDLNKLMKVIYYMNDTPEMGITLGGDENNKISLVAFSDASYGVHIDGKSHTGIYITLGLGPIIWKSIKQKCVTKSSCEAELIALSDIVSLSIWIRDMLREIDELAYDVPVHIMEDNKAAIDLIQNGASTSERSKHVHIRNCFIAQYVQSGEFKVSYCPTLEMIADIFTKPLPRRLFCYLRDYLMGRRRSQQSIT